MANGSNHPDSDKITQLTDELRNKIIVLEAALALQENDDPAGTASIRAELDKVRGLMAQIARIR